MARFTLSWRRLERETHTQAFVHRLAYVQSAVAVRTIAEALGDRAWRREFRLLRAGSEIFTDLHRIQDWTDTTADMPAPAPYHHWLRDLKRDRVADGMLDAVRRGVARAVAADVLLRGDGDALLRFALSSLRRPDL